jgi:hypothetical protein
MTKSNQEGATMKTLTKIVKLIDGTEYWFRVEGEDRCEIEFIARAVRS